MVPNQVLYQAELLPVIYGAPERSRTHNLLIRSQTLYPIELRAHYIDCYFLYCEKNFSRKKNWCRGPESNRYGSHLPQDFKSCASASSATPALCEKWSGRRDSNPRPQPWQGCILPLNYFRIIMRVKGVEPPRLAAPDPKSGASANSATPAFMVSHAGFEPATL